MCTSPCSNSSPVFQTVKEDRDISVEEEEEEEWGIESSGPGSEMGESSGGDYPSHPGDRPIPNSSSGPLDPALVSTHAYGDRHKHAHNPFEYDLVTLLSNT